MQQREMRQVAVIGTGTIGASWAVYFLSRGLRVTTSDPAPEAEARLRRFVSRTGFRRRYGARRPISWPLGSPASRISLPRSAKDRDCAAL